MSKQYFATSIISDAHQSDIFGLDTTPDFAVSITGDSVIKKWDAIAQDHGLVGTIQTEHNIGIHHVSANNENRLIAASGFDGQISIWNVDSSQRVGLISDDKRAYWAIKFSADGEYLAATTLDGQIHVWTTADNKFEKVGVLETKGTPGLSIDYSIDGKFIASGHENGGLYIYSTETARLLHSLSGHVKSVRAVSFSPLSKFLAAGGDSNIITIFDVKSGEQVFNLVGHSRWIMSLDWNITGEYILSGSFDKTLRVWLVEQSECVAIQNESERPIFTATWTKSSGGTRPQGFVSAGPDRSIRWYREAASS
ncbi:WD40-repeat-containing domain protein [Lipomyces japonicus]|uniref:WD40-repeat-containing domain protein n=1 Tax=Lipomyces japonicus TaxID=56871 RepID=UPI0034CE0066